MSEIRGAWVPHTEAEDDLLMELHEATSDAHHRGVDTEDIVAAMTFLASAIALSDVADKTVNDAVEAKRETKQEVCPECEETIAAVRPLMGGEVTVQPCECVVTHQQVPGWVDIPGGDD